MDQDVSLISTAPAKPHRGPLVLILILGVIFPIVALGVELLSRLCAEAFFNPIPSVFHGIIIALVPGLNLWGWLILWKQGVISRLYLNILLWTNGFALGISVYYTLLFLPIMLISLFLIIVFGLGLFGLTPLFSLLGGWFLRQKIRKLKDAELTKTGLKSWWGMAVAIMLLIALDAPVTLTRIGLSYAASESLTSHRFGTSLLRGLGNREQMLRACYERPGYSVDLIGSLCNIANPVSPEEARRIYYQVTGATFNSGPPPRLTGRGAWDSEEWFWDEDQGGAKVAAVIKGLSLAGSRLDTSIDPEAAVTYSQWTLTFTNQSSLQHEARAQILLPPGGVVSRLTLWIDGEEREATFAKRSQVRDAYQKVVYAQRDPVLVTSTGPDRILLQCFPVPPHGGTMRVRVGITAPLVLENPLTKGILYLPMFSERNFAVPEEVKHTVWIESTNKLSSLTKGLSQNSGADGAFALRGNINDQALRQRVGIRVERNSEITSAYTANTTGQGLIVQRIVSENQPVIKWLILVIDGSTALRDISRSLPELLAILPDGTGLELIVAGDEPRTQSFPPGVGRRSKVKTWIKPIRFRGGMDNVPALVKGVEIAGEEPNSLILWIHGPQPVLLSAPDPLEQWFDRSPGAVLVHDYQVTPGPNLLLEQLGRNFDSLNWSGDCQGDLRQFLEVCAGKRKAVNLVREEMRNVSTPKATVRTSNHLARLWANDQVGKLIRTGKSKDWEQAVKIAAAYQIVTPVSGAVVLQTQSQYQEAGLKPVDPDAVPTVPEPELPLLLILVSLLLGGYLFMRKRAGMKSKMRESHASKV